MDNGREIELIRAIDGEVGQLLRRVEALADAGGERPLLTAVGRRMRDQLRDVATLSNALADLVAEDRGRGRRERTLERGAKDTPSAPTERHGSTLAADLAGGATGSAPIVRLKPRMPRGAWRGRGVGDIAQRRSDAPAAALADVPSDTEPATALGTTAAPEPVYRLRKAGAPEPSQGVPAPREGRDALGRLREFFNVRGDDDDRSPGAERTGTT